MDIVTVKGSPGAVRSTRAAQRRLSERRHTTEVRYDQLPSAHTLSELERDSITSLSTEDLTPRGGGEDDYPVADYPGADSRMQNGKVYQPTFKNSWGANFPGNSANTYFGGSGAGSQEDLFQELNEPPPPLPGQLGGQGGGEGGMGGHHGYQLSYELALDNVLTPFVPPPPLAAMVSPLTRSARKASFDFNQSRLNHVMNEMVTTEMTYVHDLSEVIEGYMMPLQIRAKVLPFSDHHLASLFGNLTEIRDFHSSFLKRLNECNASVNLVGQCFLEKADGFKTIYTQYCNNYPNSIRVLADLSKEPSILRVLKTCQQRLNHLLPLGAYLLKPVQRVLKYSLLLSELVKSLSDTVEGFHLVKDALGKMMEVASHINAMKRKYDTAVHVQEIQSLIRGSEMHSLDLTKFGDLVLEDNFRYFSGKGSGPAFRGRTERYVFLFQRLYLVTKREEDGYQYKNHVEMKDLQLTERIEKEANSFQIRQVSTGRSFTFQARNTQQREEWVKKIKVLLVDSIPHLPDRARELIMRGFEVPRDMSPGRERRRHLTEELPVRVGGLLEPRQHSLRANSLGRNSTPQLKQPSLHLSAGAGELAPPRRVSSPPAQMQASLTGLMISSVHGGSQERLAPFTRLADSAPSQQRDSGYSDTVTGDPNKLQVRGGEGAEPRSDGEEFSSSPRRSRKFHTLGAPKMKSATEFDHAPNSAHHFHSVSDTPTLSSSFDSARLSHMTTSVSHVTDRNGSVTGDHTHFSNGHAQYASNNGVITTDEEENLFDELMSNLSDQSNGKKISTTDLDWGDSSLRGSLRKQDTDLPRVDTLPEEDPSPHLPLQHDDPAHNHPREDSDLSERHLRQGSSLDENSSTPKASPFTSPSTIRRWSVRKRRSHDYSDPDDATPKASPYIPRHHSAGVVPPGDAQLSSDDSLSNPSSTILDPPTPFRTPGRATGSLQPCPDEGLELGRESTSSPCPSNSDQDTTITTTPTQPPPMPTFDPEKQQRIDHFKKRAVTLPPNVSLFDGSGGSDHTPKATPKKKKGTSSSSVKRSKSFGNRNRISLHKRDGSLSTDNSPLPSPIITSRKVRVESQSPAPSPVATTKHTHSCANGHEAPPSPILVGLISTTRTTPDLQDIPLIQLDPATSVALAAAAASKGGHGSNRGSVILPPPSGFEGASPERCESRGSTASRDTEGGEDSPLREDKSRFSFLRLKSKKGSRSSTPSDLVMEERRRSGGVADDVAISISSPAPLAMPTIATTSATSSVPSMTTDLDPATPTTATSTSFPDDPFDPATPTTATSVQPPLEFCNQDMVSFEDALEDYNRYASETGKTARSARRQAADAAHILSHSPLPSPKTTDSKHGGKKEKKSKKKKQRHGYTVASIDADTMKEVKKLADQEHERGGAGRRKKRNTSDSKVHQLAREYSQRIKDLNKPTKRISTLAEEVDTPPGTPEAGVRPVWLSDLNEHRQRQSLEDILDHMRVGKEGEGQGGGVSDDEEGDSIGSPDDPQEPRPLARPFSNNDLTMLSVESRQTRRLGKGAGVQEEKKGKFGGWVRSLAARFGGKKEQGTSL